MQNTSSPTNRLSRTALLFPLCLVLYEFSTYICNDMIQPGMLSVIEQFNVDDHWVPTSMTAYLAGGMSLQWLLGPISDRIGRRPVMLTGVIYFILTCLGILLAQTIEGFIAYRFLQGMSLCFIGAVGYAAIQESYEEAVCIKITALMANVALIAPLLGPLAGAALVHVAPWQTMFYLFALLAAIALVGLWRSMPETVVRSYQPISIRDLWYDYKQVFTNKQFLFGAFAIGFASIPLLVWIAQSPVILIKDQNLSNYTYGLLQLPIFGALILGNFVLIRYTGKYSPALIIQYGAWPTIIGLILASIATLISSDTYFWMITGLSIYAFGLGITNSGLYRLTLFASSLSKGIVAATVGMLTMAVYTIGIELAKVSYFVAGNGLFNLFNAVCGLVWLWLTIRFLSQHSSV